MARKARARTESEPDLFTKTFPDPDDAGRTIVRRRRSYDASRGAAPRVLEGTERAKADAAFARAAAAWADWQPTEAADRRQHARALKQARRRLADAAAFAMALWTADPSVNGRVLDITDRALRDALAPHSPAEFAFEIATLVWIARADIRHRCWLSHADRREEIGLLWADAHWRFHVQAATAGRGTKRGGRKGAAVTNPEKTKAATERAEKMHAYYVHLVGKHDSQGARWAAVGTRFGVSAARARGIVGPLLVAQKAGR